MNENNMMGQEQKNMDMESGKGGSAGPIIGIIVILIIIILGGLYFWGQKDDARMMDDSDHMMTDTLEDIKMQDESDDAGSIEDDLNATDIESVDSEINAS